MTSTPQRSDAAAERAWRVPPSSALIRAWKIAAYAGALGMGIAAYGLVTEPERFVHSYLFGFYVALSLALGNLFFVLVLYMTKASWGVTVRRLAENFIRPMAVFAVLVIPLILPIKPLHFDPMSALFPWVSSARGVAEHTQHEAQQSEQKSLLSEARGLAEREPAALREVPILNAQRLEKAQETSEAKIVDHKRFYLNQWFFLARIVAYLAIWAWIAHRYFQWSTEQDDTKAPENTAKAQSFAPLALILYALTQTFFAFDWLLSLDATWYSTIFGVQVFAQCALFQMAVLIVAALWMNRAGLLGASVNVEHYHDMGKLMFGWIVFWSYISFAQFFLTWYSNIPDEVAWFHKRWEDNGGTWMGLSIALVVLHFFVPFWFLMSRNIKRRLGLLAAGAVCMILMHIAEAYWLIMPSMGPLDVSLLDFGCLIGVVGVYLAAVLYGVGDFSLVPVGDPRLVRALEFENA